MRFPLAIAAAVVAFAGAAQAQVYSCDFTDPGRYNTIPEKVFIEVAKDGASAMVNDPFLHHMGQGPKEAKFFKNTSKVLRARWVVKDMDFSAGGKSDMHFSLVYRKDKQKASITLNLPSYDNTDSGNGICKLVS